MEYLLKHIEKPEGKVVWNAIRIIFRLLATSEVQAIIQVLLKSQQPVGSTDLREKAGLTESQFHPALRQLVKYKVLDRKVNQDRSVSYSISVLGTNILKLSNPLLDEIKKNIDIQKK
jgi:DNA-binding MarR family transcriptional regulator